MWIPHVTMEGDFEPGVKYECFREGEHTKLQAENKRLREALEEYGDHDHNCSLIQINKECDCGFEQVLQVKEDDRKE